MLLATGSAEPEALDERACSYLAVVGAVKDLGISLPGSIKNLAPSLRSSASAGVLAVEEYVAGLVIHTSSNSKAHRLMMLVKIVRLIPRYLDAKRISFTPRTLFQTMKNPGALMHHSFPGYSAELQARFL